MEPRRGTVDYEELFNLSYWRVFDRQMDGMDFLDAFYDRFVSASPTIREHFKNTDMDRQKDMLRISLVEMSKFFVNKTADSHMQRIARIHSKHERKVKPELYDLWLESLIDTVRNFDPDFNHEIELSWRMVLSAGITYMKFKYDHDGIVGD